MAASASFTWMEYSLSSSIPPRTFPSAAAVQIQVRPRTADKVSRRRCIHFSAISLNLIQLLFPVLISHLSFIPLSGVHTCLHRPRGEPAAEKPLSKKRAQMYEKFQEIFTYFCQSFAIVTITYCICRYFFKSLPFSEPWVCSSTE